MEQVPVLVVRRARDDAAIAGQDVHGDDRIVHEAVPKRRCLDADAGYRAAKRDRLQLGHDGRHRACGERGVGKIDERRHALGFDKARLRVDANDLVEVAEIDAGSRSRRPVAKEIRCRLGESNGSLAQASRRRKLLQQPRRLRRIRRHGARGCRNARLIG